MPKSIKNMKPKTPPYAEKVIETERGFEAVLKGGRGNEVLVSFRGNPENNEIEEIEDVESSEKVEDVESLEKVEKEDKKTLLGKIFS